MFVHRNIKYFYLKTIRKIRGFLLGDKSRESLVFLFFFIIASGFWLLQTLNYDYETEFSIPLRLKKVPGDVVLTSGPPEELRITVKDKGTVLLNYMLGKSFYPVILDFDDYKDQGSHVNVPLSEIEKKVMSQLLASTKLLSVKPEMVDYIYSKEKAKKIPVRLQGKISAGKQYYISDTICSPDSVVVFATQPILDTIKAAYTHYLDLSNITDTVQRRVNIVNLKGAKFVPASVNLTLLADIYTEKTLEVTLNGTGFPPGKILRTFPSKVKVTFQVGLSRFKKIHTEDFILNVSYDELVGNGSDKYRVKLKILPAGVSHVRFSPSEVDFLIEQNPAYVH